MANAVGIASVTVDSFEAVFKLVSRGLLWCISGLVLQSTVAAVISGKLSRHIDSEVERLVEVGGGGRQ